MADIPNRGELERRMARLLARFLSAHGGHLLEKMGDPPRLENLPLDFWSREGRTLAKILNPFLEDIFLEQARILMMSQPVGADWALVNEGAIRWSSTYTFELIKGMNETTQRVVSRALSNYYQQGQTIGELQRALAGTFGPVRAEMIAVTEVTRASVQGEMAIAGELRKQGIEMIPFWETNADELVCPICLPRNGKRQGDGWSEPPPAHPRCRCWLNHKLPKLVAVRA